MKKLIVNPVGLKGKEIHERQLALMGIQPINENENKKSSAVELTKIGPDGNAYAIIRENHEYYIKKTSKTNGLVLEDFKYIGGLQNKKDEAYPSYAKAIKHLNLKFKSLAEAYGKGGDINVFEDDNLLSERAFGMGFSNQGNMEGMEEMWTNEEETVDEYDKKAMQSFIDQYGEERGRQIYYATANKEDRNPETFEKTEGMTSFGNDVEMNEYEMAIDEMINSLRNEELHGGQHKLDVDGDGEIEASDLEKVRAGALSEVSDEGKYTWKDLGDFDHDMVGDFVEYNGQYYKVVGNGQIDDINGNPTYSAHLENVKTGENIEVDIHDITRINPNDVGIEWADDDEDNFGDEVSDIEGKYNINPKHSDYFGESIYEQMSSILKAINEVELSDDDLKKKL